MRIRVLDDLGSRELDAQRWDALLSHSPTDAAFLTHEWQRLWWQARGDELLTIVLAERDGELLALAPLFAVEGSVSLVGSGGSDYLDFIGRPDEATLAAMLAAARDAAPGFAAIELYHVPARLADHRDAAGRRRAARARAAARGGARRRRTRTSRDAELVERLTARRSVRKEEARMRRARRAARARGRAPRSSRRWSSCSSTSTPQRWRAAGEVSFDRRGARELVRVGRCRRAIAPAGRALTVLEWQGRRRRSTSA